MFAVDELTTFLPTLKYRIIWVGGWGWNKRVEKKRGGGGG